MTDTYAVQKFDGIFYPGMLGKIKGNHKVCVEYY